MSFWWGNIYGTFCLLFPIHLLVHDGFFVIVTLISSLRLPIAIVEISMYFCYSLWRFSLSFIVLLKGYGLHSCSSGFGYQGSAKVCAHLLQWMLTSYIFRNDFTLEWCRPSRIETVTRIIQTKRYCTWSKFIYVCCLDLRGWVYLNNDSILHILTF